MANKKDANGDPLCTACLDARVDKRRAEFLLHEGRAPVPPFRTMPAAPPVKRSVVVFQRRGSEGVPVQPAPAPTKRAARTNSRSPRSSQGASRTASKQDVRAKERRFAMLVLEIGFLRAEQLLGTLKTTGRSARRRRVRGT